MKWECLDNTESKSDNLTDTGGEIYFKGWNHENPKEMILQELKEEFYEDQHILDFEIVSSKQMAYSCLRFWDGQEASEEGYSYWIDYQDTYKKGMGKCTLYTIKYNLKYDEEYA